MRLKQCTAVVCLALALGGRPAPAAEANQIHAGLIKTRLTISLVRFLRYWPNPSAAEPQYKTWSWAPRFQFNLRGPIPGGSQLVISVDKPNGKGHWMDIRCETPELGADEWREIRPNDPDEKTAITEGGSVPFQILLKNELSGKDAVWYKGTFKVSKFLKPLQEVPEFKGQHEFVVDQDWRVPFGFIYLDTDLDDKAPALDVKLWFRYPCDQKPEMAGYLFYKGEQIASTKVHGTVNDEVTLSTAGADRKDPSWHFWTFQFAYTRATLPPSGYDQTVYALDKHPGEYEVKVLANGKLTRAMKFTIGADGKLVDPGLNALADLNSYWVTHPVTVLGELDSGYKPKAWETDAWYGNPIALELPAP